MRSRVAFIFVTAALVLALGPRAAVAQGPRLVLFEGFLSIGCPHCELAGQAIEQLAGEYAVAGEPVILLEQNTAPPTNPRQTRFLTAYAAGGAIGPVYFPWAMVDGGHQMSNGPVGEDTVAAYVSEYRRLVSAELTRSPRTDLQAYSVRLGDDVRVYVEVTNLASALSIMNGATVWALVYEDVDIVSGANLTGRYVRGVASQAVTGALAPGASASYTLDVTPTANRPLSTATWHDAIDWSKLHVLAFVDYRPGGATGAYDVTQATIAPTWLELASDTLNFAVDPRISATWSGDVALGGPATLAWQASSDSAWLTAALDSASLPAQVRVSVDLGGMPAGGYVGHITFSSTDEAGMLVQQVLTVSGSYVTYAVYVPVVQR